VHDAGLDDRLGEHGSDRIGQAFEPVDDGQHDVFHAAVFELVHDAQTDLAPSFCSIHRPRTTLAPSAITPSAIWIALLRDHAFIADLDPDRIEEHQRVSAPIWLSGTSRPLFPDAQTGA